MAKHNLPEAQPPLAEEALKNQDDSLKELLELKAEIGRQRQASEAAIKTFDNALKKIQDGLLEMERLVTNNPTPEDIPVLYRAAIAANASSAVLTKQMKDFVHDFPDI
jgi:seryl-tRNA synthetase